MPSVYDDVLRLWNRIAGRPFIAKISAAILVAGIFSLMSSPGAMDRGRAGATSLMKSPSSRVGSATAEHNDCTPDRTRTSEASP